MQSGKKLEILDTTLRDGALNAGISFSVRDKLDIAAALDSAGIHLIEAGIPGMSDNELSFFHAAKALPLKNARLASFSGTRRKNMTVREDPMLGAVLHCGVQTTVIGGISGARHAEQILQTTPEENLAMIAGTVEYLTDSGLEVLYDAEHYFDAWHEDRAYALETLRTALRAGARCVVLCDTAGGTDHTVIAAICRETCAEIGGTVGIHCHNDAGVADAATLDAVRAGATHVQGTFLGYGARCGNACLSVLIPTMQLKWGCEIVPPETLQRYTDTARLIADIANAPLRSDMPYVGSGAFVHKGGVHADAVLKSRTLLEHVDPAAVGNQRHLPVSEQMGRKALIARFPRYFPSLTGNTGSEAVRKKETEAAERILKRIKEREAEGYRYEAAVSSLELLVREEFALRKQYFQLIDCKLIDHLPAADGIYSTVVIKLQVGRREALTTAEGSGPVHALDAALRAALNSFYPALQTLRLVDYKVGVLTPEQATAAVVRVLIRSTDGVREWETIGVSSDIIEASYHALRDAAEMKMTADKERDTDASV